MCTPERHTEKEVGMSDVCPANGEWVSSSFTTSMPMQGMDSVNTCINAGLTMEEGVKLSAMNGNMVYVCCVPRSVEVGTAKSENAKLRAANKALRNALQTLATN